MKKRFFSILLVFCMIFSMMPMSASAVADSSTLMQISSATQKKLGLSDSDVQRYEGYYAIRNAADLFAYGELLSGTYDPVNAILLHDIFLEWGTMWTPLCMNGGGIFEGNGKTIGGIRVNMPDTEAVGFFSYVANGTIRNLTIGSSNGVSSSIIGKVAVGAIAGQIAGSTTIENCAAKNVKLKAHPDDSWSFIGGLVGHATSLDGTRSVIENSYFGGTVTVYNSSTGNVGCIIGDHTHVTVSNCTWLADHAKICDHDSNLVAVVNRGTGDRYDTTYEDFQGELLSGTGDSHTHRSVTTTSLTATCEYGGYDSYSYCLVCDAILAGNKNQTEAHHEYVGGNCTTEARCTICGGAGQKKPDLHSWSYGKCEWCSKSCNHSYDSDSMCTICRATCPHQQYENGICKECGYYCEHDWDHNKMQYYSVCNYCGLLCGHSYHESYRMDATCSAQGLINYKCAFCTSEYNEILEALEHDYTWTYTDTTHEGYCSVGKETKTGFHNYSREYFDPTCTEDGYYADTCTDCGYTKKTVTNQKLDHYGGEATCKELAVCERCGEGYGEYADHVGGEATCTQQAICDVCGEGYGELKRHESDLDDNDCTTPVRCSDCGAVTKEGNATHTWDENNFCSNENCQQTRGFTFTFTYGDEVLFVRNVHTGNFYTFEDFQARDGLTLVGWVADEDADEDGEPDFYPIGDYTYVDGDMSFNAVYKLVYTVRFITYDIWEGAYTESFNPIVGEANQTVTLWDDFSSYYKFLGWATEEGGEVVYEANEEITLTENLTLYGVIRPYQATFDLGEGAVWNDENGNPITVLEGDYSGSWIEIRKFPTRPGYVFKGFVDQTDWFWEPWQDEDTGEWVVDFYFDRSDLVMTAVWEECTEYNYNGFCTICGGYEPAELVGNYYEISNAGQLYWFAKQVNSGNRAINGKLTANIVVNENVLKADGTLNGDGSGFLPWTPMGNFNTSYTGTFDGNGKTISGLYVNGNTNYVGLFGNSSGTVKHVGVVDSYLSGDEYVGGVVGCKFGTVENCYNTGSVSGSYYVGGVVGQSTGYTSTGTTTTVKSCYNSGSVSGIGSDSGYVGGVVGYSYNSTITGCYNTGAVSGGVCVGGVVGSNSGTAKHPGVVNCYNKGSVSGSMIVGGVAGDNCGVTIAGCYNAGKLSGSDSGYVGGVVGYNAVTDKGKDWGTVVNCYYDSDIYSGHAIGCDSGIATDVLGKTTADFASGAVTASLSQGCTVDETAYSGDVWGQNIDGDGEKDAYPVLGGAKVYEGYTDCDDVKDYSNDSAIAQEKPDHDWSNSDGICVGCGTACKHESYHDSKCTICGKECEHSYANGKCTVCGEECEHSYTNLVCTACGSYEPAELVSGYYEIGNASQLYWFAKQVNDGQISINGKLTANIVVNENVLTTDGALNGDGSGFLPWTPMGNLINRYTGTFDGNGKTVSGLYFNDAGTNYVGLFGMVEGGTVKNVGVVDSYFRGYSFVGGVMAGLVDGTVSDCYNAATVIGYQVVGGVAGVDQDGTITNCYNTGAVSGDLFDVGGVVGHSINDTITNCYNTGAVSGNEQVGGVVGYTLRATISDCYNTGAVSGEQDVGGVVGNVQKNGTITNCYYDSTVYSGDAIGSGEGTATKVEGKTTAQFKSGEVAYLLGDAFGQTIGTDMYPVLGGAKVYEGYTDCDDVKDYSNDSAIAQEKTEHSWNDEGICASCGAEAHVHTPDDCGQTCKGYLCADCGRWYGEANINGHSYDNDCDADCNICGATREVGDHVYQNDCDADCDNCGETREVGGHIYDEGCYDLDCNSCGESRITGHTLTYHEAKIPANCQEKGYEEYWTCSVCGAYFGSADASLEINPDWIYYTGEHVRPEGSAPCAVVPCEICGEDSYGLADCDRGDAPECQDACCIYCGEYMWGKGCSYGYDEETWESLIPLCQPGDCIYCGTHYEKLYDCENDSWAPCSEAGECVYGCGKQYAPTGEHNVDDPCAGGLCWFCWEDIAPVHSYDNACDADCNICGATREVGEHVDDDDDNACDHCDAQISTGSAQITDVSITVDGEEYSQGETAIITPDTESLIFTVSGKNFANLNDEQSVIFAEDMSFTMNIPYWEIDDVNNTATLDLSLSVTEFEVFTTPTEILISNDCGETLINTGVYLQYSESPVFEIVQQPVSVTGTIGETVSVSVVATGEGLSYKWYIRNAGSSSWSVSSITSNTYETVMNKTRANRELYCVITDANGNTLKTDVVMLIGQSDEELMILTQPTDTSAKLGENYCVEVIAQGDGLKYQWYFRNKGQSNWNSSGVKDNTYDDVMNSSRVGREVYCVITDAWGNSVTTDTVTLIGIPETELAIVEQPTDVSAEIGEQFVVSVEAVGEGLRYAWYWRQIGAETWNISGQKDNTYDTEMNASRHNREVYCVITDAFGNTVSTDIATITGTPTRTLEITRQPENQTVTLGDEFHISVEAQGDDIRYQWYFRKAGTENWTASSQKDNSYDDVMTAARHNRELYCVITDAWGNTVETSPVVLIMAVPAHELSIVTQPEDTSVKMGEAFCVAVEAQGDGLKYQWYWRNVGAETWNSSGQRDNTYDDVMTKARHNREVYCVITDMWGESVETDVVTITAAPDQVLAIIAQPADAYAAIGENYCVTVEARGDGLKYQWYFRNEGSNVWHKSGVNDNTYDDVMTKARAGRQVYCVITDIWGASVTTDTVTLICK